MHFWHRQTLRCKLCNSLAFVPIVAWVFVWKFKLLTFLFNLFRNHGIAITLVAFVRSSYDFFAKVWSCCAAWFKRLFGKHRQTHTQTDKSLVMYKINKHMSRRPMPMPFGCCGVLPRRYFHSLNVHNCHRHAANRHQHTQKKKTLWVTGTRCKSRDFFLISPMCEYVK